MRRSGRILQKLDWIAKLSKDTCPVGAPEDPDAVRALLNRMVKDVRDACAFLSDLSDLSDTSDDKNERQEKETPWPHPNP